MEYLVILHGEVYRDEAFVVPPNCKLKFTASANTTNLVGSNISYSDIFSIQNSDEYITGNICEDILLSGPTSQDWVYPGLCGVIPKNQVNKMELTYYANGSQQLRTAFQRSILKFDYWYDDKFEPKKRKLSDVITELIKLNPSIVLHLLNCRNINAPSYFGDCLGYLPVTIKGNTFLTSNKCTINDVPKLGNLQGDTIGGEGEESLIMIYELTPTQKNEIIQDIYELKIPDALKQKLLKNEIWKTLIDKLSIRASIIKLTGLQPCLIILLNIFINNGEEYKKNVNPRIKDLDDTNDLKPALEILAQSATAKFGGFVRKSRRRYARSLKKPKTTAARIAVKHHKDPKE